jgi:hypothetical protein
MPLVTVGSRSARLDVRSGIRYFANSFAGESETRRVHQSDARLSFGGSGLRVTGEGRFLRADEGDYPYVGAEAEAALGKAILWAAGGKWLSDEVDSPVWGGGALFQVGSANDVFASFRQETNDPLYWQTPRRSWSVGVSRRLGVAPARAGSPVLPPEIRGERVTFRLPIGESTIPPLLGGDFTSWEAVPMTRNGEFWTVSLPIPSGVYRYAFRRPDGEWFVPVTVPDRVEDGFGGYSATLVVP